MPSTHSFLAENRNCASSPSARNRPIAPHILSSGTPLNSSDIVFPFCASVTGEVAGQMFGEVFAVGRRPVDETRPPPAQERAAEATDARRVDDPTAVGSPPP